VSDDPGASFADAEKLLGLRKSKNGWKSWRRAALDFAALNRRLDLKCDFNPAASLTIAATPEQTTRLKKEQKARQAAGVDVSIANAKAIASEVAMSADMAFKGREGGTLDPYRAAVSLAAAAAQRGARIFERSPADRTTFTRKSAVVHAQGGQIKTMRVVIATGIPTMLFKSLRRHFWFKTTYSVVTERVPAKVRRQLGQRQAVFRDLAAPPHTVRWLDEDRLMIVGADSDVVPVRQLEKTLIQRTGQLMYELSTMYPDISGVQPAYGWSSEYALTAEGIPYIGPHRNFPHHLFAFGDASHSVTAAYLASRIFLRHHLDEADPADDAFAFTR
jgi:glycine/D-amino acid oxidase-like deaminating enzyme